MSVPWQVHPFVYQARWIFRGFTSGFACNKILTKFFVFVFCFCKLTSTPPHTHLFSWVLYLKCMLSFAQRHCCEWARRLTASGTQFDNCNLTLTCFHLYDTAGQPDPEDRYRPSEEVSLVYLFICFTRAWLACWTVWRGLLQSKKALVPVCCHFSTAWYPPTHRGSALWFICSHWQTQVLSSFFLCVSLSTRNHCVKASTIQHRI